MKKLLIGIIIIIILCGGFAPYITMQHNSIGPRSFAQTGQNPATWLVKINGKTITLKEFEQELGHGGSLCSLVQEHRSRA